MKKLLKNEFKNVQSNLLEYHRETQGKGLRVLVKKKILFKTIFYAIYEMKKITKAKRE